MKNLAIGALLVAIGSSLGFLASSRLRAAEKEKGPKLAHMVFFELKDHSRESVEKFIASCDKYLTNHEGGLYYSVGTRATDVDESVSVKDFDVALHVIFDGKEAKAKYLQSPRHHSFVEENLPAFGKVRVFDSYLTK